MNSTAYRAVLTGHSTRSGRRGDCHRFGFGAAAQQANQPILVIVMAEQGVKAAGFFKILNSPGPYDLTIFNGYDAARHAVARGFDLDSSHYPPPIGRSNLAMTAQQYHWGAITL
jgi:hypothetical protein